MRPGDRPRDRGYPAFHRTSHHDRSAHGRMLLQDRFDLAGLDSMTPNLQLGIETAHEFQSSIRKPSNEVPGPIPGPVPGIGRIRRNLSAVRSGSLTYPRAIPSPPIHTPGLPSGTGDPFESRISQCVPRNSRDGGGNPVLPLGQRWHLPVTANVVVSVDRIRSRGRYRADVPTPAERGPRTSPRPR